MILMPKTPSTMDKRDIPEIDGLVAAMNVFDSQMAQHLTATAAFAERVATTMALDADTVENCRIGALLHDIGWLGIDKSILTYPGMLVEAEWDLVTNHPKYGARLLMSIPTLVHIAPIVRAHHERIDGSGYPDGLMSYEIPLESRIIAVADAFHTMTMPHGYRYASATTTAMAELVGNCGSQFDEEVVQAFGAMIGVRRGQRLRHLRGA
jgi:HD-GYP domain-containing protein (c-di-GMP phosphodiesterase class II)